MLKGLYLLENTVRVLWQNLLFYQTSLRYKLKVV